MNESITVIDKNGNNIVAEGIACIQFVSSGKKYILYTLNEKVENDLTKMYVGEIGSTVGELDKIADDEWLHIKTTLNGISHGEANPDLKYLNMNSIPLNIGTPKKLAIKPDVKQAFSDRYNTEILKDAQSLNPNSAPTAQTTSGFFNNDVVGTNQAVADEPAIQGPDNSSSIFENPMKPDLTTANVVPQAQFSEAAAVMQTAPVINEMAPQVQPLPVNTLEAPAEVATIASDVGVVSSPSPIPAPVTPVAQSAPMANALENPIVENISTEVMSSLNNDVAPTEPNIVETIEESPEPVTLEQMMPANQVKGIGLKQVTREEALAALDVLNRYINQNGGTFNGLAIGDNTEITMKDEEVNVPKHQVEDTSNEEPVVPTSEISQMPEISTTSIIPETLAVPPVSMENNATVIPSSSVITTVGDVPSVTTSEQPTTVPPIGVETTPQTVAPIEVQQPVVQPNNNVSSVQSSLELPLNTPEMIPTIDANSVSQPQTLPAPDSNFISMGVNDINNMVQTSQPSIGDALQVTGSENLINLDAIPTIPEVDLMAPASPQPTALTSQPISNAYVNSDPSGIPVTLPNNYNTQGVNSNSSVLGPGSLPTENN